MRAYKTFSQMEASKRPVNIPLNYIWEVASIKDSEIDFYEADGFTVVSDADYDSLVASLEAVLEAYNLANKKVPKIVTPRQIRIALILSGFSIDSIVAKINLMASPDKEIALASWDYSNEFQRNNPLLLSLALALVAPR